MTVITLPWPPNANNLFLNAAKRRIRSPRYDAWILSAQAAVLQQRPGKIRGEFDVEMGCERPDRRKRDLDGLFKAPLDLLVKMGVIEDDSLAQDIRAYWVLKDPAKPGCVRLTIREVG